MTKVIQINGWTFTFSPQHLVRETRGVNFVEDGTLTITAPDGSSITLEDENLNDHTEHCARAVGAYLDY